MKLRLKYFALLACTLGIFTTGMATGLQANPQTQAPTQIVAENADKSRVNRKTQGEVSRISAAWGSADKETRDKLKGELAKLHETDKQNVALMTWLGYVYVADGEMSKAIPVLEAVRGKSSSNDVNVSNLKNLAYATFSSGMYGQASSALRDLNQIEPKNAATLATLGNSLSLEGKHEEAIPVMKEALELIDKDDAGYTKLRTDYAIAHIKAGKDAEALALMEQIESEGEATEFMLSWMGFAYLQQNKSAEAIRVLEKARAMSPQNVQVANNLANAYSMTGNPDDRAKAIQMYVELCRLQPTLATPWYNAGSLYLIGGDFRQAREYLSKSVSLNRDPFALNNLGRAHEGLNEMKEAAGRYGEASDLRPENAVFARNAGLAFLRIRDEAKAKTYLERAIKNGDSDPDLPKMVAEMMTRSGDDREALAAMELVREKYKNDSSYWFNVGVLRHRTGDEKGAEEAYKECLRIKPDDIDAINNLGLIMYKRGDYEQALTMFEKLAGLNTTSIDAKVNLAAALAQTGRKEAAITIWKDIVRLAPERIVSRLDLADALYNAGDSDGARFHYSTALKQDGKNVRALNGLGLWHLGQSSNVEAEKLFRRAIQSDANYLPPYINLAITLERMNKRKEAIEILERALKINPNFEDARKNLARLKSAQ